MPVSPSHSQRAPAAAVHTPRAACHLTLFPRAPVPPAGQLDRFAVLAEPRGRRSASPFPRAAHRLYAFLLLLLPRPGAWHRGPLPDARGPAPLSFTPRILLLTLSSNSYYNSLTLSLYS